MSQTSYGSGQSLRPVPQQRIVQKLDEYMSRRDIAGAQRHLLYWLEEARAADDKRGELMLRNELVGHFRKTGDKEQAFLHADEALSLIDELEFGNTISAGTTYTNVGTAYNAFGEYERSLELLSKAKTLYESNPNTEPQLLGGLYNNMALTCVALCRYDEADRLFHQALDIMADVEHGQLEQAITYLNMADAAVAKSHAHASDAAFAAAESNRGSDSGICEDMESDGCHDVVSGPNPSPSDSEIEPTIDKECEEVVECFLDTALELLDTPSVPRDGYYAFVCEKCAPVFAYYGYFLADADLKERAKAIYERA
ncbi:MAG: tetratricopeptide repeat protein [Eggerthellaceae bacterium]|nr:tetratricopeptide repeat protein [Eggerthellaceae bacterium]